MPEGVYITVMETQHHARQLIPDYVLGLLTADDRHRVEQHTRECTACREALRREGRVETMVRETVQRAAAPPARSLQRLRPTPPRPATGVANQTARRLAPAAAVLALLLMSLLAQVGGFDSLHPSFALTANAPTVTMTSTHTPTATLASLAADAYSVATRPPGGRIPPGAQESPRPDGPTAVQVTVAATPIISLR